MNKRLLEITLEEHREDLMKILKDVLVLGGYGVGAMVGRDITRKMYESIKNEKSKRVLLLKIVTAVTIIGATGVITYQISQIIRTGNKDAIENITSLKKSVKYTLTQEFGNELSEIEEGEYL